MLVASLKKELSLHFWHLDIPLGNISFRLSWPFGLKFFETEKFSVLK